MKTSSPLFLAVTSAIVLLFSQCREETKPGNQIPFNPERAKEHIISIKTAANLTSTYAKGKVALSRDTGYLNKRFNIPAGESFNRDAIAALLNQKGAKGIRIYMGQDTAGLVRLVLVAVDARNNDITGTNGNIMKFTSNTGSSTNPFALEAGQRCPTLCSLSSTLYK